MRPAGVAFMVVSTLWSAPALATGEIVCMHPAGASIDLLVGRGGLLYVDRAIIHVGDDVWTTSNEMAPRGTPVTVGQAFEDDRTLILDITDEDRAEIVARLRVLYASEGEMRAAGGTLQVVGRGAWAVDCIEPE